MAITLNPVKAGDLITAELFNQMIQKISEGGSGGGGGAPPGSVAVPSVFGQNLEDAAGILAQPAFGLNIGITIDAFGTSIDPDLPESQDRIVLMQMPAAGVFVMPGSVVDLLLSAKSDGGGTPSKQVKITGFSREKIHIKQDVIILGENFDQEPSDNEVTFDGIPGAIPGLESSTGALFVFVPEGIPNAPTLPGQEKAVKVRVKAHGTSDSRDMVILAPLAGASPSITNLATPDGSASATFKVGDTIMIKGANFAASAEANKIMFTDTPGVLAANQANSTTALFVTAPAMPGHANSVVVGASVTVTVVVEGVDRVSNSVGVNLVRV